MSCVNGAEMWVLDEKKFIFVNRFIESHSRPIKFVIIEEKTTFIPIFNMLLISTPLSYLTEHSTLCFA